MKGLKKILTGIVASALALTMAFGTGDVTAKAAETTGTITISNTTEGKDYSLYKVFDATYVEGTDPVKVAYSYDGSNSAFLAALKGEGSPFELTEYNGGYNVIRKANVSDTDVTNFIKENAANFGKAVASDKGTGKALTFTGLGFGYYYITSQLGSEVTITSAVPSQTVIDKNQETTIDKQESVDGGTEWKYVGNGTVEDTLPTQLVGKVVNYKVSGTVTQYNKDKKVTFLLFTDTMSEGLTPNQDVVVKVNGTQVTAEVKYDGQVTTIKLPTVEAGEFLYESNASYEITYTATINEKALDNVKDNKVVLTDNNGDTLGTDETKVRNYSISLKKTDEAGNSLADAHFRLYGSQNGKDEIPVVLVSGKGDATSEVDNVYRVLTAEEVKNNVQGVEMVTGKTGVIVVKGLKNGDYYFEETAAPAGYNRLTDRKAAKVNNADVSAAEFVVVNKTGSILPSTGGIGTTIFYIVGGVLIAAAFAYFMLRRKAQAE